MDEMRECRWDRSGQVLILAALMIALIISSTMVYMFQLSQVSQEEDLVSPEDFVRIVKLGSQNLMIGVLANISLGGDNQMLETSLERWKSFVEKHYYSGQCSFDFDLSETPPYSSGLRIFWGDEGLGVTSAEAGFSLNLTDEGTTMNVVYSINLTTSLDIYSTTEKLAGEQSVNVTIFLYNEGEPALAKNLTIYYKTPTGWKDANLLGSFHLEDYGNGTYISSFIIPRRPHLNISVQCYDRRDIYVRANATSTQI